MREGVEIFETQSNLLLKSVRMGLGQWFPNFSATQTTENILVVREAQNIDLDRDLPTTLANLADH